MGEHVRMKDGDKCKVNKRPRSYASECVYLYKDGFRDGCWTTGAPRGGQIRTEIGDVQDEI